MKRKVYYNLVFLVTMVILSLVSITGEPSGTYQPSSVLMYQLTQSTGTEFDMTLMPGFADLIPGTEPVNLILELRVGVSDPDGVSKVIGSYKNNSISEWTNVTMSLDDSTSNPDDYVAWPHNYTMTEPSFVVIWDIKFYANDSLNNWNVSSVHQLSICRQTSTSITTTSMITSTTTTNSTTTDSLIVPFVIVAISVLIIIPVLYIISQRRI
ncbi:MAG: hypothetical protein OEV85_01190 [Candidatus Thorarchaeota archaeon]|nr:hypothetical protein [Candidatus Thorarchaeota archaeon]